MFKKLLSTASFLKNKPHLAQRYIVPDTKFMNSIYTTTRQILFFKDFFVRKNKLKKNKLNFSFNKLDDFNANGYLAYKNLKKTTLMNKVLKTCDTHLKKINWKKIRKEAKKPFLLEHNVDLRKKENFDILLEKFLIILIKFLYFIQPVFGFLLMMVLMDLKEVNNFI